MITAGHRPRKSVGLDVDGVLMRWGTAVRSSMKKRFGVNVSSDEWFGPHLVTPEQWDWVWSDEGVVEVFGAGPAFHGAIKFTQRLATIADIHIISACPDGARDARVKWLDTRGIPYTSVNFVQPAGDGRTAVRKSTIEPHCDVYIDDNPGNCLELARETDAARIILVDHSWNQDEHVEDGVRIVRLRTWDEILNEVKRLSGFVVVE